MSERIGTCQDCGQRYGGIPDTLTATKIRCKECSGTVVIPPLESAPAAAAPTPAPEAAAPAPAPEAAQDDSKKGGLAAKPVGDAPKKERPAAAAPVDREVAKPAKKAAKKPDAPKKAAPAKPVFAPKSAAKPAKPIKPVKPAAKPAKPVKPVKPVAKPAQPAKPVKPAAPAKPVAKPAAKPAPAEKPAAAAASSDDQAAKKARAAAIIAKAKAKRAQEESGAAPSAEKKAKGADVLAQLKAKRAEDGSSDQPAAAKPAAKPAPKPAAKKKAAAGGARKASSSRAGSSRRQRDDGDDGGRRERRQPQKKGAPMGLLVVSLVGIGVLVGGFFWWQGQQGEDPSNTEVSGPENPTDPAPANPVAPIDNAPPPTLPLDQLPAGDGASNDAASGNDNAAAGSNESAPAGGDDTSAGSGNAGEDAGSDASATPPAQPSTPASADFIVPGPGEGVQTRGITDPAVLDLMSVPLLEKFSGSTDEEFAELVEDLELYLEDGGAQSNRAGNRVVDAGRAAFPVIINAMLRLDYTTQDGHYVGGTLNRLLYRAGGENKNYRWDRADQLEPGSAEFDKAALWNKKVVGSLQRIWVEQLASDDAAWERYIAKPEPKDGE